MRVDDYVSRTLTRSAGLPFLQVWLLVIYKDLRVILWIGRGNHVFYAQVPILIANYFIFQDTCPSGAALVSLA